MECAVRISEESIKQKKSVVIGLQSTGASHLENACNQDDDSPGNRLDLVANTEMILKNLRLKVLQYICSISFNIYCNKFKVLELLIIIKLQY